MLFKRKVKLDLPTLKKKPNKNKLFKITATALVEKQIKDNYLHEKPWLLPVSTIFLTNIILSY